MSADNRHMNSETRKESVAKSQEVSSTSFGEQYADETVHNYDTANFVKVTSFQWGFLLAIGKMHPTEKKIIMSKEILLPFEVAASLSDIITKHLSNMQEKGLIEVERVEKPRGAK